MAGMRLYIPGKLHGRVLTPRVWLRLRAWGGETLSPAEGSPSWRCPETRSTDKVPVNRRGESAAQRSGRGWGHRRRVEMRRQPWQVPAQQAGRT